MSKPTQQPSERPDKVDAFWRRLTSAAARAPVPAVVAPAAFATGVLEQVGFGRRLRLPDEQQRLVATAACFALAASLLICLWSWPELQAAWSPTIAAPPVPGEVWP